MPGGLRFDGCGLLVDWPDANERKVSIHENYIDSQDLERARASALSLGVGIGRVRLAHRQCDWMPDVDAQLSNELERKALIPQDSGA